MVLRRVAARRARKSKVAPAARPLADRLMEIRHLAERGHAPEPDFLLRQLADPEPVIRRAAAWSLGTLKEGRGRGALEASLSDPDAQVRGSAAHALGAIARSESREALERALSDPVARVRSQAAWALWALRDPRSFAPLRPLLKDPDPSVRWSAAVAIGRLEVPERVDALGEALEDPHDRVRREAILGLGHSGDPRVPDRVRPFLNDPADRVRIASAVVLGQYKDRPAVPVLLKRLKTDGTFVKPSFLVALGRIGDATAIPVLVWASRDPAGWVRVCAIQALGQLRAPEAGEIARERLHDPSWSVRGAAADCLGVASGDGEIVRGLLEALEDPHPWPRRCALYALGRRAIGEAAPRVREELNHPVAEVRLAAIWALGRFQDDGAREPLLSLLRVTSPTRDIPLTLAQGEGAVKLLSDAEGRLFDTLVQALGRICRTASDPLVHRALAEARARLTEEELDRPARLPSPEGADGVAAPSLRQVFDLAESACGDDDDL